MTIEPIAIFHSPFGSKFGIPRQSGLSEELRGEIHFNPGYRNPDAIRGLEDFRYIWLIWEFSGNKPAGKEWSPTVRPPRLGGNKRLGVWATRSPFRPNNLGLSSVKIDHIDWERMIIHTLGADLMDGTPIYDIKPYLEYADSHPGAGGGFTDSTQWKGLEVVIPSEAEQELRSKGFEDEDISALRSALALDPRPHYQNDPSKIYGFLFNGSDIHFTVSGDVLTLKADVPAR